MCPSDQDRQLLEQLRAHAQQTLTLLSNPQKQERERMVCRAFLRGLGITFREEEICSQNAEPVDVSFRSASFQITELLDPDRKRTNEWRERLERYKNARCLDELKVPYSPPRAISYAEVVTKISERLAIKAHRYGNCQELDALIYVDLSDAWLDVNMETAELQDLQDQGWRSVSFLFLPYSLVLYVPPEAPPFLRVAQGTPLAKWGKAIGWFDPVS